VTEISSPDYQERDAVAMRAYEIWQRRGCPQGTAMQDWLEAEAELRHERRARLEATRLFEPPAPMEIGPAEALVPTPVLAADGSPAEPPAKRRRARAGCSQREEDGQRRGEPRRHHQQRHARGAQATGAAGRLILRRGAPAAARRAAGLSPTGS
jgi:hypothetical protein